MSSHQVQLNKPWYIHTIEDYVDIENENSLYAVIPRIHQGIFLSENRTQCRQAILCFLLSKTRK